MTTRTVVTRRCTGLTATWCPEHGDCRCPRRDDGDIPAMDAADCPLHALNTPHPASRSVSTIRRADGGEQ